MFNRVLIANRGEVAVRIIRACWEMGIETVAIYSSKDKESMHVKLADKALCIGPAEAGKSYLEVNRIIEAAKQNNVDAIHPGYGFLSESYEFAEKCLENNIVFIGPSPEVIKTMGTNKMLAKEKVKTIGIPIIPGIEGIIKNKEHAKIVAEILGYPLLIKAANGGGGKGIRKVCRSEDFERNFSLCVEESYKAFGNQEVYIEKYIEKPRHIEVQILVDKYNNVIILGERECSIQRGNQKLIEESPAAILENELRGKLFNFSKAIAIECGYYGSGTIEFLIDEQKNIYFMEMNTRLQVEHPVTEFVTNVDIVKEQIRIAYGERLKYREEDLKVRGHSIECRINAEQPEKNFSASSGVVSSLNIPGGNGVRVDTAVYVGMKLEPIYDSNIAKLIVYGRDRHEAIRKMKRALCEFIIEGVDTNIEFLLKILNSREFIMNEYNTATLSEIIYESF